MLCLGWDGDSFALHPQIRSVIRRSRETGHVHPMSREPSPRRRLDPATLSRTPSQERLIAELQGRLGIQLEAEEVAGASAQDWLTEGVVITVQPRGRRAGGQLVEKVASKCWSQDLGSGVWRFPQFQCWLKKILGWWVGFCISWPYDKAGHTTLLSAVEFLPSYLSPLSSPRSSILLTLPFP